MAPSSQGHYVFKRFRIETVHQQLLSRPLLVWISDEISHPPCPLVTVTLSLPTTCLGFPDHHGTTDSSQHETTPIGDPRRLPGGDPGESRGHLWCSCSKKCLGICWDDFGEFLHDVKRKKKYYIYIYDIISFHMYLSMKYILCLYNL